MALTVRRHDATTSQRYAIMKPAKPKPIPEIIRAAIERVTGDPYQARREIVQAILDDLAAAGYAITRRRGPANAQRDSHER